MGPPSAKYIKTKKVRSIYFLSSLTNLASRQEINFRYLVFWVRQARTPEVRGPDQAKDLRLRPKKKQSEMVAISYC
jgi:hypothetical protein